jgi:micrococcal nuclease
MWMDFRFKYVASGDETKRDPLGVVDGDTLNLFVDKGTDEYRKMTVRLYGINAPEMRGKSAADGQASKQWVIDWFGEHCPDGKFVIETIKDNRDRYGRYLAIVTAADGHNLNDDIIEAGHAVTYFP